MILEYNEPSEEASKKQLEVLSGSKERSVFWGDSERYTGFVIVDKDPIVEEVRTDLHRRSEVGIKKYHTTLNRQDLNLRDWLEHAYQECLDQALYLKRAIVELDTYRSYDRNEQGTENKDS